MKPRSRFRYVRQEAKIRSAWTLILPLSIVVALSAPRAFGDVSYVLEPEAMKEIAAIIDRMKPALRYTDIAIESDHVIAHMCPEGSPQSACFALRLEHPDNNCGPTHWGQFCVRFPQGTPSSAVTDVIANALRAPSNQDVWTALAPPPEPPREAPPAPSLFSRMTTTLAAWVNALRAVNIRLVAQTLGASAALTLGPLAAGWLVGSVWRRRRRQRQEGLVFAILAVTLPAAAALMLDARIELIGAWDALFVGVLAGAGLLLALHRACADWKNIALMLGSCLAGLFVLELASRLMLPPPPAFPSSEGPRLFLSDALQAAHATGFSMTQAGATACHAIYSGDNQKDYAVYALPATWRPRPDAHQHILHLGDSMVFGMGEGRFTDYLNRLEPDVEHVNAAIPGTGPDVYLSLLRLFIARHDFAAVVIHLTGNDFWDVDDPRYPCSDWKSLLAYEPSGVRLRFPKRPPDDLDSSRLSWLVQNSPPPFVLRAGVRVSSFAAHLAAAWVDLARRLGHAPVEASDSVREAHLAAILRVARDELSARHIPLVVDSFRERRLVESGIRPETGAEDTMKRIAEDLGIATLDTWEPLVGAVRRGIQPFTNANGPSDPHFNAAGHELIAEWLHEELPRAIDRARAASEHVGGV